ncbi:Fur family transcriptional regulator [Deinococcus aquatilis]|uniref:Fur family transcriptional regulator n=1 Tax=Deinococcus aquatilis TaxID=519440 RepID=UPI0003811F39|nr:Fur family transcriptional regulator [Deinococcus aquatilis]
MTATRTTRQRDVIAHVLEGAEGPLAVSDVHGRALSDLPGLGIATVYRTLKLLTEQGRIHPVTLDGETRYEASGKGHHHHFSCTRCGRVFTLHTCPVALPRGTVYPGGFIVEAHEVTLYGQCPQCAAAPA